MSKLVIDLETRESMRDIGGKGNLHMFTISVVGVYSYATNTYRAYTFEELGALAELLTTTKRMIGFNTIGFDVPILKANMKRFGVDWDAISQLDIMAHIQEQIGYRIKLDTVAKATLEMGGKGDMTGLDAIRFWKEGRIDELKNYCLHDVQITKEVYEYGLREGRVLFEGWRRKYTVPVQWN